MKPVELWEEFIIHRSHEQLKPPHNMITLCGLCGNDGIVDTSKTAEHRGMMVGIVGYCICPNGRARKSTFTPKKLGSVVTTRADGGAYPWEEKE